MYQCKGCGASTDDEFYCDACYEQIRGDNAEVLNAPVTPLPAAVWRDIVAALTFEMSQIEE